MAYIGEIDCAVMVLRGEAAHSLYFSKDAFAQLKVDNKVAEFIPGAVHADLYDNLDDIPFDKFHAFFEQYLG